MFPAKSAAQKNDDAKKGPVLAESDLLNFLVLFLIWRLREELLDEYIKLLVFLNNISQSPKLSCLNVSWSIVPKKLSYVGKQALTSLWFIKIQIQFT